MDYLLTSLLVRCDSLVPLFDLGSLLQNLVTKAKSYGSGFIIFLGIIMIAVAAFKIGKGLMTQGKPNAQPINWFLCAGLLIVGGTMAFGGFSAMGKIATSVDSTIDDLTADNMFNHGENVETDKNNW
jgi:hypothetical protein